MATRDSGSVWSIRSGDWIFQLHFPRQFVQGMCGTFHKYVRACAGVLVGVLQRIGGLCCSKSCESTQPTGAEARNVKAFLRAEFPQSETPMVPLIPSKTNKNTKTLGGEAYRRVDSPFSGHSQCAQGLLVLDAWVPVKGGGLG